MAILGHIKHLSESSHSPWVYAGALTGLVVLWQVCTIVYNLFFHPLRKFPGPLIQRASPYPFAIQHASGYQAFHTQKLHEKYGPVVRIGPNHLSFTDPVAWKDIYGHRVGGVSHMSEMTKAGPFSQTIEGIPTSIINTDREEHGRFRRALSHGFSDSSMREQESIIRKYVDALIRHLRDAGQGGAKALNVEAWYNWTTFDVTGDLVFGQSFSCLESADYHPWIEFMFMAIRSGSVLVGLRYVGLGFVIQAAFKLGALFAIKNIRESTDAMLQTRIDMEKERDDLFEGLLKKRDEWNLSFDKLSSTAFILVLAGSETTATTLSGATYLLLAHPDVLKKLQHEVRSAFNSVDEIKISSVGKLSYMLAVLNETLRMYPPVTSTLVRTVPDRGEVIAGHFVPGGTYVEVPQWSANHSKDNWVDPWEFKPERFLHSAKEAAEMGNKLDALQAFSVGPRNCLGRNLAYAEMRLIMARLVFEFDLELMDDSKDWIKRQKSYTLWARIPLNVKLTPVKRDV